MAIRALVKLWRALAAPMGFAGCRVRAGISRPSITHHRLHSVVCHAAFGRVWLSGLLASFQPVSLQPQDALRATVLAIDVVRPTRFIAHDLNVAPYLATTMPPIPHRGQRHRMLDDPSGDLSSFRTCRGCFTAGYT